MILPPIQPNELRFGASSAVDDNWPDYCGDRALVHDAICCLRAGHAGAHEYYDNFIVQQLGCGNWRQVRGARRGKR